MMGAFCFDYYLDCVKFSLMKNAQVTMMMDMMMRREAALLCCA